MTSTQAQSLPTSAQIAAEERAQRAFAADVYLGDMTRLDSVVYALLQAAAPYCANNRQYSLGVPPSTAASLPVDVRQGFMETRSLQHDTDALFIHVPASSPSAGAGIRPGDILQSATDSATNKNVAPAWFFDRPNTTLVQNAPFLLKLRQGAQEKNVSVGPQLICRWKPFLIRKDEPVAGIAGERLNVSSGLLRFVRNNDELAWVLSHELAHAIIAEAAPAVPSGRHPLGARVSASPEEERAADYLGTYIALLGGFNVERAQDIWRRIAAHPPARERGGIAYRHTFSAERSIWLRAMLAEVHRKKNGGEQLLPDPGLLPAHINMTPASIASLPSGDGTDARLGQVANVPFLSSEGRSGYQRFLASPLRPRAFAINPKGGAWAYRSGSDATSDAVKACEAFASGPCYLYAVDELVVWNPETAEHLPQAANADGMDPRLNRVEDVPMLNSEGRAGYERFLNLSVRPRAFAIGPKGDGPGAWAFKSGPNASADALAYCTVLTRGRPCYLYAVDDAVIWHLTDAPALSPTPQEDPSDNTRSRRRPAASGFAEIDDLKAIPLPEEQLANYRAFLEKPSPRAFVISQEGFGRYWLGAAAMENALGYCERLGDGCWLYAVDDEVVWQADKSLRISRRTQLPAQSAETQFLK